MNDLQRRTWAEISLDNIRHNYRVIRSHLPEQCKFLGVVKADAYGHGAKKVASMLERAGADYLAVSCLDEALELRSAGITLPILILGHTPEKYTDVLIQEGLTQTVTCLAKAHIYSQECERLRKKLKIHIKVDTGMSRLGFLCSGNHFENSVQNIVEACGLPGLIPEGVYTHFAESDNTSKEAKAYTKDQFSLFIKVIDAVSREGVHFSIRHCANSGAVVRYPEMALDMVRPGLLLYGYGAEDADWGLRPCMRLVSTISTIKIFDSDTGISYGLRYKTSSSERIAVLSLGYADGLMRALSNKCSFYVAGGYAPQRGSICMDMCMIDVSGIPEAKVYDEVEIFGFHNSLQMLCNSIDTIPYEFMCSVSKRVPRVYTDNLDNTENEMI